MSFVLNPDEIKRREYFGLALLAVGSLILLSGLASLLFSMPVGVMLVSVGTSLTAAGVFILSNIPDVINDELW